MKMDEISALLEKYQNGACTEEERKAIDEWYESLKLGEDTPLSNAELEESLAAIRANLPGIGGREEVHHDYTARVIDVRSRMKTIRSRFRVGMAAAIVFLLAGSVWWFWLSGPGRTVAVNNGNGDTIMITGRGETRQIILPDGSTIQLNAGTVFSYPRHFTGQTRSVTLLSGEAFFQVTTDPSHPFIVKTGQLETTVLGTSFDIRSYAREKTTQVAVLTGKVGVMEKGRTSAVFLTPHQLLRADSATGKVDTTAFDQDYEVAAWKEGALNLKDASFEDIAFELGNKYNVTVLNHSDKHRWSYTGLFRNESLQEVLETICQTEHLNYTFGENGILITNK